jgi:hypothetical protein
LALTGNELDPGLERQARIKQEALVVEDFGRQSRSVPLSLSCNSNGPPGSTAHFSANKGTCVALFALRAAGLD